MRIIVHDQNGTHGIARFLHVGHAGIDDEASNSLGKLPFFRGNGSTSAGAAGG
jgi:hypothetical protein